MEQTDAAIENYNIIRGATVNRKRPDPTTMPRLDLIQTSTGPEQHAPIKSAATKLQKRYGALEQEENVRRDKNNVNTVPASKLFTLTT